MGFNGRHGVCDVRRGLRPLLPFLVLAVATSSCLITGDGFGGKFCRKNEDCPAIAGYLCASTATWPQRGCGEAEEGCLCEIRFPPDPGGIGFDGGGPVQPDAGPPPDYCTEIKPILELNCLGTCHGNQMQYPNSPTDFRLDYWEPGAAHRLPDGGPGLPGVKTKIDRIKARMVDEKTMPPGDFGIFPTATNIALVNKWVTKFGAPLGDGGCELGMTPTGDGGTMDAGTRDGGVDAGTPVSFSAMVVPIFTQRCAPCHTTNTAGGLSLTAANAYNALVNIDVSATCAPAGTPRKRVLANAPMQSQLWLKIRNDGNRCGNSMPNGLMPLLLMAPNQADVIDRWIRQGAPNN